MSAQSQNKPASTPPPVLGFRPGGPMGLLTEGEKSRHARGTLLRLWGYLKVQRWVLVGTAGLVIVTSAVDLVGPYLMGLAIDQFINKGDLPGLARLIGWMIG